LDVQQTRVFIETEMFNVASQKTDKALLNKCTRKTSNQKL